MGWYLLWRFIWYLEYLTVLAIIFGIYEGITGKGGSDLFPWWIGQILGLIVLIFIEKKIKPKADKKYNSNLKTIDTIKSK